MIIKHLTLYAQNLTQQKNFFVDVLGFELIRESEKSFEIRAGLSILKFEYHPGFKAYHFAFGIPFSMYKAAFSWLKERVEIIKDGENEIVDFPAWDAKAIYFYDQDQNICEFIARKSIPENIDESFSLNHIFNVTEIGLVISNIKSTFDKLHQQTSIKMYDGSLDRFLAVGDNDGLFICIDPNKKDWFPTNDKAEIADFMAEVEILDKNYSIKYLNGELEISSLN
ncbi:VOC family protein [Weeksellaceae bacterium KMM 9713]|uniref:VOC family protein n=1 Tax=Profundicola chukchiensis TaxID=2961959 RepID=A0A9X4MUS8_9FLAO|nr:VOC family protein [Profundicola chukchiensis]MDG4945291.1 VOC family protein [Profundicola chukchiensis]